MTIISIAVRYRGGEGKRFLSLVPILLQAVVLPVMIVGSGAVIYDGIRHVLFLGACLRYRLSHSPCSTVDLG